MTGVRVEAVVLNERAARSSSALGDNVLKYLDMHGRVVVDLMKVVQRDHKLDSYKLDAVAEHFTGLRKNDVSPNDVFRYNLFSRRRVARRRPAREAHRPLLATRLQAKA